MPRNFVLAYVSRRRYTREGGASLPTDSATENKPPRPQGRSKGEKARQELTACRVTGKARNTPSGARPNRKPGAARSRSARRNSFGYRLLRQMVLSPDFSGQTKFGLQPGRNHLFPGGFRPDRLFRRFIDGFHEAWLSSPGARRAAYRPNFAPCSSRARTSPSLVWVKSSYHWPTPSK